MSFYAVANGKNIGIFTSWNECCESVKGYKNAKYKKFDTREKAEEFILSNNQQQNIIPVQNSKANNDNFEPDYYVYTDGSCIGNGSNKASAGIGIFFGTDDPRNVSGHIIGERITNNIAELTALIELYPIISLDIREGKRIGIVSDSTYAIRCATDYGEKCNNDNWKKDIPNKELVRKVYELYNTNNINNINNINNNIRFIYVEAHTGKTDIHSVGNQNADKLANQGAQHKH